MKPPIILIKVSLIYSPLEDRIRLTGQVSETRSTVLWLTQRICQKLVRAVGHYIEKASVVPTGSDRELVLSFKQSAAMVRKAQTEPVIPTPGSKDALVERIDVSYRKDRVLLRFLVQEGEVAQFGLSIQQARQWLGILRRQYREAGWPMDVWPVWITEAEDPAASPGAGRQIH